MLDIFKSYVNGQAKVTNEQFGQILSCLTPASFSKGTVLLSQGEVCPHIAFVVKGCLRSYITDENKKMHILEFAPENWWLGDALSLYQQVPSLFYIDAVEDSQVLLAKMDFFKKMPEIFPDFYQLYIYHMHEGLRSVQKRLQHLLGSKAHERYLDFLATYPELGVRLPQHMIASYLGISPESLSRIRNKFANRQ
jgi:CRP-like cAMP-binding protein